MIWQPIERLFASDQYASLDGQRLQIRNSAEGRKSWDLIAQLTMKVDADLPQIDFPAGVKSSMPIGSSAHGAQDTWGTVLKLHGE